MPIQFLKAMEFDVRKICFGHLRAIVDAFTSIYIAFQEVSCLEGYYRIEIGPE